MSLAHVAWGDEYPLEKPGRVTVIETVDGVTECYKCVQNCAR